MFSKNWWLKNSFLKDTSSVYLAQVPVLGIRTEWIVVVIIIIIRVQSKQKKKKNPPISDNHLGNLKKKIDFYRKYVFKLD